MFYLLKIRLFFIVTYSVITFYILNILKYFFRTIKQLETRVRIDFEKKYATCNIDINERNFRKDKFLTDV